MTDQEIRAYILCELARLYEDPYHRKQYKRFIFNPADEERAQEIIKQHVRSYVLEQSQGMAVRTLVASTIHDISGFENERTCISDLLPNHQVMPDADLCIIMGGQGSVQCALTFGTPILGFPLQPEQELNLALAERQGTALRIPHQMPPIRQNSPGRLKRCCRMKRSATTPMKSAPCMKAWTGLPTPPMPSLTI